MTSLEFMFLDYFLSYNIIVLIVFPISFYSSIYIYILVSTQFNEFFWGKMCFFPTYHVMLFVITPFFL